MHKLRVVNLSKQDNLSSGQRPEPLTPHNTESEAILQASIHALPNTSFDSQNLEVRTNALRCTLAA